MLNDSSFEEVELNTVITVFSLDHLNIDSELDLFDAISRYAKAQDKRHAERSLSPPNETRDRPKVILFSIIYILKSKHDIQIEHVSMQVLVSS